MDECRILPCIVRLGPDEFVETIALQWKIEMSWTDDELEAEKVETA